MNVKTKTYFLSLLDLEYLHNKFDDKFFHRFESHLLISILLDYRRRKVPMYHDKRNNAERKRNSQKHFHCRCCKMKKFVQLTSSSTSPLLLARHELSSAIEFEEKCLRSLPLPCRLCLE